MLYVGIDLHARTFSYAVVDGDCNVMFEETLTTSCENLREAMERIVAKKKVVFEESDLASWAYRVLEPHVDELIVADPKENHWIAKDQQIHDKLAARKLAKLLRGGYISPVHHTPDGDRQAFKGLVLGYHEKCRELRRVKNKLKAKFRQDGVVCSGSRVYSESDRESWLSRLELSGARLQARLLYETMDHLESHRQTLSEEIGRRSRRYKEIARFEEVPGIGLIRAATFYAIIDTPHRFADKRKVWSYCGIGIAKAQSADKGGPEHLNRDGNRYLKDLAKGAASSAILGQNRFARDYERRIGEGKRPSMARLTVARAIVATLYAMWRDDAPYRPLSEGDPRPWPPANEERGTR